MKLNLIIKEVADNLGLPYKDVNAVIRYAFLSTAKEMKENKPKITVRYLGTFIKKLGKREKYKNYLKRKNEDNRDK
jgi:nucleoid DNA-binding protein